MKKFNEFINEENIVDGIKGMFNRRRGIPDKENIPSAPKKGSYPLPSGPPEDDIESSDYRGNFEPKQNHKFPVVYSFLTKEKEERLRVKGEPIGIRNHGYQFLCDTQKDLDEIETEYAVGNKYNDETITDFDIGPERDY